MKLEELDTALVTFAGNPVSYQEPDEKGAPVTKVLTRKLAILNCLGAMQTETGLDAIRVFSLGTLVFRAGTDYELTNDDHTLIRQAVEQNKPGYVPLIQGQLLEYLA